MAKHDWNALLRQFEQDHERDGMSVKQWCESKGLKYASARRYIKMRKTAHSAQKKSAHNDNAQSALSQPKARQNQRREKSELPKNYENTQLSPPEIGKPHTDESAQFGAGRKDEIQRDERGYFLPGNRVAVGNVGNTGVPENAFGEGNQLARKSGMYARCNPPRKNGRW
ncbi:hypothetical protein VR7878_03111 [Vibrio ruber DSM 16370]|uniref:Terminase small subunit n=1 Tax=Vibrio ruber (strain DSM 16370 / JCM 11486 / BCRC 17186 / CECT 7878 / LMG 23124 / VR1) TaxID=1123498 RepID=A0A1R4LQM8_VIBR1|nr:hypothetical protein [Vibrio ruber]SJN58906.1 hypothetical protein VR7878_03111 [Vibrio ruber DSM 16370]